ncbi:hypothetical protein C0989_002271 [Termitomyces sp. Mn162]|nr:hypothetical protein C0989_002271 [Termitomyces sp. Mn162]
MFLSSSSLAHRVPHVVRAASTRAAPRGLAAILQKNPDDVVITFAKRTPIGRAKKGQFKDVPVDEMLYALFKASLVLTVFSTTISTSHPGDSGQDQTRSFQDRRYLCW